MGKELEMVKVERARVTLTKALTYKLAGVKFIKDLPKIIVGAEKIRQFKACAFFSVADLAPKMKEVYSEADTESKKVSDSKKKKKGNRKLLKKK